MKKLPHNKRITVAEAKAIINDRIKLAASRRRVMADEAREILQKHIEAQGGEKFNDAPCARCQYGQRSHMLVMCAEPKQFNFGRLYRFCPPSNVDRYSPSAVAKQQQDRKLEDIIREAITPPAEPPTFWERFCYWMAAPVWSWPNRW